MLVTKGFGNTEILQIAYAVAREKNIKPELVLDAMASSIAVAARKKYGHDKSIKATIDRKTGEVSIFREFEVVSNDFEPESDEEGNLIEQVGKIPLKDAVEMGYVVEVGDVVKDALPPIDLGRVSAQTAKQVIIQKVKEAERERQFKDYESRVGEIINGTVKRVEFGSVIVDLGNAEAVILKSDQIKGENFRLNDRVRAYVREVSKQLKGPQIFLSRTAREFMAKLFAQEVPEVYDGIIEVKAVAREPGSRAKVAVYSNDSNIDPVGSCVGIRGARVQAVIAELHGEKIDIVQWSADPATFVINAIAPAEASKVVIDEDSHRIEVVVPDDQLSLAIGRRGQNVRLASELTRWKIDIMTEDEESSRRTEDFTRLSSLFITALNIDEIIAHLLVSEGFSSIEEIAYVTIQELASVEGFDEGVASELQGRALNYLAIQKNSTEQEIVDLGVDKELAEFEGLNSKILIQLGEKGVKTLEDFADLARDEFLELVPNSGLKYDEIDKLIMKARSKCFGAELGE